MIILEVSNLNTVNKFSNLTPFIYSTRPARVQLADFWVNTFGVVDQSKNYNVVVSSVIRDLSTKYNQVYSYDDLLITIGSFFWNSSDQILFIHFEHNYSYLTSIMQYGSSWGFSDKRVAYIDDIQYSPLLLGAPSVSQSQDISNYNKLSFVTGNAALNNGVIYDKGTPVGVNDYFINANVYNNDALLYYFPENKLDKFNSGDRSYLVGLGSFYVEDYTITLERITFVLQDQRKAQDVDIPTDVFTIDEYPNIGNYEDDVIPLVYGTPREINAIPTASELLTGNVNYRAGLLLTDLGSVYVEVDEIWTLVTPDSFNLSTGEFTLLEADGRNSSGAPYRCKLIEPTGISISKTSDIIIDLNERYLGISYLDSFYDTTEWDSESSSLSTGAIVFDSSIKLFDAIKEIQNKSIIGFRYEIKPDGKRTIRIDDNSRNSSGRIPSVAIQNRNSLPVTSNHKLVYANVTAKYYKSWVSGKSLSKKNSDYAESVLQNYKNKNSISLETILTSETDAIAKAADYAERYSTIPLITSLNLMGEEYLGLRILDVWDIELTPGLTDADSGTIEGREYFGFQKGKVLSIAPDPKTLINKVKFQLIKS